MIEIVYNEEEQEGRENENPVKLPKNIRQIGEIDEHKKIYMEDYVVTYLTQLAGEDSTISRAAVLLGEARRQDGCQYLFISSAIEAEAVEFGEYEIKFTEDTWTGIYENIKKYFDNEEIVGWFLSVPGFALEISESIQKTHINNFAGTTKVFFMREPVEGEDAFFIWENNKLVKQTGYYIYYEKNEPMQEYMIGRKNNGEEESAPVEEVPDQAAVSFRTIMQEKKEDRHQKRIMTFMYTASTFLVLIVFVIGINMINNYDKMKNIEATLTNLSDTITKNEASGGAGIPVQSVSGDVSPQSQQPAQGGENPGSETDPAVDVGQTTEPATDDPGQADSPEAAPSAEDPSQNTAQPTAEQPPEPAGQPVEPQPADPAPTDVPAAAPAENYYTVEKGDTLAKISRKLYGDYSKVQEICQLNGIEDGDHILAGSKLKLP